MIESSRSWTSFRSPEDKVPQDGNQAKGACSYKVILPNHTDQGPAPSGTSGQTGRQTSAASAPSLIFIDLLTKLVGRGVRGDGVGEGGCGQLNEL